MTKKSDAPAIRFKGFSDAWEQRKFEEIAVRSSVICSDDTLPRVEYEDIVSGTGRLNKDIYAKQSSKSGIVFHQGDVLYGKLRPYLQNWLLPTFDGLAVGDFWVLQPQNADSSFLYRLIQSRQFDEVANQSTGTKMPRADWKLVSKTVFSIPSNISEQAAIGTYFTALDSLITLHQRKFEKLTNVKKSMLEKMFPQNGSSYPEIRFKGFTDPWEQRKWINTVDISTNMVDPKSGKYDLLPHVAPGNIESFTGRLYDNVKLVGEENLISGKFVFNVGDIVYGKINPQLGKYVFARFSGLTSADAYVLNAKNGIVQKFLYAVIQTRDFYDYSVSVSKRSGMPKINRDELNAYSYWAPSESEQLKIGEYLLTLDHLITLHQRELEKLQNIKKSMLEKMFV